MKKRIGAVLASLLVLMVAACGNNNQVGEASPPAQTPEAVVASQNSSGGSDSKAETGTLETDSADSNAASEGTEDDFQNPTMNFVGPYAAEGVQMEVSASGKSDAEFKVTWSMVEYDNCVKTDYVYNEDGSVMSETSVYIDGTGRIIFNPQDGTLVWEDEKEHVADALIFEYSW